MLGNLRLRNIENFLEMADAKRTTCKQMDDPQPRGVAETLVNLNQFHGRNMAFAKYSSINIFIITNIIPPYDTNLPRVEELTAGLSTGDSRHLKADIEKTLRGLI